MLGWVLAFMHCGRRRVLPRRCTLLDVTVRMMQDWRRDALRE